MAQGYTVCLCVCVSVWTLQDLTLECSNLQKEKEKLLAELSQLQASTSTPFETMDQEEDNSLLQQSFTALQVCCIVSIS